MTSNARRLLSAARLHVNSADGLAWWTYLSQTHGIADDYLSAVADEALASNVTFVTRLRRCPDNPPARATKASQHQATTAIRAVEGLIERFEQEPLDAPTDGWAAWLLRLATSLSIPVADDLAKLLAEVAKVVPADEELTFYLNQLEPVSKDLALQTAGVAIMTLTRSKGLTFRAAIICGVEDGVIPSGRPGANEDEERRLLYVGITRAREYCYLTMAGHRNDATARSGGGEVRSRSRCRFLSLIRVHPEDGHEYISELAKRSKT
jgi:superfamily I DNA/RNA helicase